MYDNKRKVLFVEKNFQLNLILKAFVFFCLLFLSFLLITYLLIVPLLTEISYLGLPPDHSITLIINNFKFYALWFAIIAFFSCSCFVIMASLLISHRIAGPIYALKRTLQEIISTQTLKHARSRKNDCFMELNEKFNEFIDFLQKQDK